MVQKVIRGRETDGNKDGRETSSHEMESRRRLKMTDIAVGRFLWNSNNRFAYRPSQGPHKGYCRVVNTEASNLVLYRRCGRSKLHNIFRKAALQETLVLKKC